MIKTFKDKNTQELLEKGKSKILPADIINRALHKLLMLNKAKSLDDLLLPPSNRLHKLTGDREGQHSISINMKYRICFKWQDNNAYDVEVVDYH